VTSFDITVCIIIMMNDTTNQTRGDAMKKLLKVWVSNQPEGIGGDGTEDYMAAAGLGRTNSVKGETWNAAYSSYVAARKAVKEIGHGSGCEDMDDPCLVAMLPGAKGAAAGLQQNVSETCDTWEDFVQKALVNEEKLHEADIEIEIEADNA
jgi:hypothetical protein